MVVSPATPRTVFKLGTRGSLLARTQSQHVADLLQPFLPPGVSVELVTITTSGDRASAGALPAPSSPGLGTPMFDKGMFVKELEESLLNGTIDFAVHSAKDLPIQRPAGLIIASTPPRENPFDVWIGRDGVPLDQLPKGARVGTVSQRRAAQLLAMRPDLTIVTLRGNIDTRLRKTQDGTDGLTGTLLAAAGLLRTNLLPAHAVMMSPEVMVPSAGQGTLVVECREEDTEARTLLKHINDVDTARSLAFERGVVEDLAGGCLAPIGVLAQRRKPEAGAGWIVRAIVARPDGTKTAKSVLMDQSDDSKVGEEGGLESLRPLLVKTLNRRGASDILRSLGVR